MKLLDAIASCAPAQPFPTRRQPLAAQEGESFIKLIDAGRQASCRAVNFLCFALTARWCLYVLPSLISLRFCPASCLLLFLI